MSASRSLIYLLILLAYNIVINGTNENGTCLIDNNMDIICGYISNTSSIINLNAIPSTLVSCKDEDISASILKMLNLFEPAKTRTKRDKNSDDIPCLNTHKDCLKWSMQNECILNEEYMEYHCAKSCNTCFKQTQEFRQKYCKNEWYNDQECINWAKEGECILNPSFMREQCSKSCNYCDYEVRCKPYKYYESALNLSNIPNPSMYDKIFYNLLSNKYLVWKYNISLIHFDPPIIEFNNFIPDIILSDFINSTNFNFRRSADAGELDNNFVYKPIYSEIRTSKNDWCHSECEQLEITKYILSLIEEVTNIKRIYFEQIQVLKYEIGEHYNEHHDFIDIQYDMPCGPRILTLFIYLNSNVIGGETYFPNLKIKVKPKKGKAILWPNILSNDPYKKNEKTNHAALDVMNGTKHAMNVWIHLNDFSTPFKYGCTG